MVSDSDNTLLWVLGLVAIGVIAGLATGVIPMVSEPWTSLANWRTWAATIAATESKYGIPSGLLSALGYQESGYQSAVINGTQASSAGALGMMQLEPAYFSSVQVAVPFSSADIAAQIDQAGSYLAQQYQTFGTWAQALAAYNAGPQTVTNVNNGTGTLPASTQNYVASILGNTPSVSGSNVASATAPASSGGTGATGMTGGTGGTGSTA